MITDEKKKLRQWIYSNSKTLVERDIAPIPLPVNRKRRTSCKKNLMLFCKTYFSHRCNNWTAGRKMLVKYVQNCIVKNQRLTVAMPRGIGKSAIAKCGIIWALAYGYRRFVLFCSATKQEAEGHLDDIRTLILTKPFSDDFPEVSYPFKRIEVLRKAAGSQLYHGNPTRIRWDKDALRFAEIRGSASSGSIVSVMGIKGTSRGKSAGTGSGALLRPDFVIIDDPQTDMQAKSPSQISSIIGTINKAILPTMTGSKNSSVLITCTVIERQDVAEHYLQDKTYNTFRIKSLDRMPDNEALWVEWFNLYCNDRKEADSFYRKNKKELHEGAVCNIDDYDKVRFGSVLQSLMFDYFSDPEMFFSERQNTPDMLADSGQGLDVLDVNDINKEVKIDDGSLFAGLDVHDDSLYYVISRTDGKSMEVLEYGVYPKQPIKDKKASLSVKIKKGMLGIELNKALEFLREKGIKRVYVDARWETVCVKSVCFQNNDIATPIFGWANAKGKPISEWTRKPGSVIGQFYMKNRRTGERFPCITIDTNLVKDRLVSLFSNQNVSIAKHNGLSVFLRQVLTSEYPLLVDGTYKRFSWIQKSKRIDNHFLDALVYSYSANIIEKGIK